MLSLKSPLIVLIFTSSLALQAQDRAAVTIHNHTGANLTVRRPSGGSESPIRIHSASDCHPGDFQRLCCAYPHRSPEAECPVEYQFKDGDTATFRFEETGQDLHSELIFWHQEPDLGVVFKGTVLYSLEHRQAPDGACVPVGRLALPKGPTPRTQAMPQNRSIRILSDSELELR